MPLLVLSRKPRESLVIGDNITVTVIETRNGAVKLAIEAPRHTEIWRTEILPADHPKAAKQTS